MIRSPTPPASPVSNLEAVALPNRVTSAYGYNALNRLTALRHTGPVSVLFDAGGRYLYS